MNSASRQATGVALGGLVALAAAMGIGRFVYTPILPFMMERGGLTEAQAGIVASANYAGYLLGALIASWSLLPGGRRTWLLAALTLSALTTAAMGLTSSLVLFTGLRFAGGVASAFVLVFATALVLDRLAVAGRSGLSSVHFAGVGCGIALSALLVAGLAAAGFGWRGLWIGSGIVSILALAGALWLIPPESGPPTAAPGTGDSGSDRRFVSLVVAYGLVGFGYVITATFISTIVRNSPELRPMEPVVWLAVGVSAAPSVALWAATARRWGNGRAFAAACLAEAVGVALSVLSTEPLAIITSAVLLGGTFMGLTALGLIGVRLLAAGDPRRNLALMTASFGLGQMVGPAFAGFTFGFGDSFLMPSLAAAAALTLAAVLARKTG